VAVGARAVDVRADSSVLVVDDDPGVRGSVAEILRGAGYRVCEARDGASALAQLTQERSGAMVLDVRMPGGGGQRLLDSLGPDAPPVVLVSGYPLGGEATIHGDPRVFNVLQKPFKPRSLLDAIAGALGRGLPD